MEISAAATIVAYALPVPIILLLAIVRFRAAKRERDIRYWVGFSPFAFYFALHLLLYSAAAISIVLFGIPVDAVLDATVPALKQALVDRFTESPALLPPLGALVSVYWITSTASWSAPNNKLLDQLLTVGHLRDDLDKLHAKLITNKYAPSPNEANENLRMINDRGVYIASKPTSMEGLRAANIVQMWTKVSCLIRFAEEFKCDSYVSPKENLVKTDDIHDKHEDRTELALHILRLEHSAITTRFPTTSRQTMGAQVVEVAPQVSEVDERDSIVITETELEESISRIESFLQVQYTSILRDVAKIAAYGVIYAGPEAESRLEELKSRGFGGIGTLEFLSYHLLAQLLFRVFVAVCFLFIAFWFARIGGIIPGLGQDPTPAEQINIAAVICLVALSYVGATLCGSLVAANRRLRQQKLQPWSWYLLAGCGALLVYFALQASFLMIRLLPDPSGLAILGELSRLWPSIVAWSPLIFATACGIPCCAWQSYGEQARVSWSERLRDALGLSCILALGAVFTAFLHLALQSDFGSFVLRRDGAINIAFIFFFVAFAAVVGAAIGAVSINLCRRIARSSL